MPGSIGRPLPRPDGPDKVRGRTPYVADLEVPGAWTGACLRSPVARGRLLGFDFHPDFDLDRVVLVRRQDIPGANRIAMIVDDQPILAEEEVRHCGEPLLLVAAPDPQTLAEALAAIRPRIEELEPVLDMEASEQVFKDVLIEKGDALGVLERAERVIEGTYRTDTHEQMYIEPQGVVAWASESGDRVTVKGSLQCPHYVRNALVRALAIEPEDARVEQVATGGGFGGKEDYPSVLACCAALLARASGHPVRMILDRSEDLAVTPKRHPSLVRHRTAVAPDGRLLAAEIEVLLDGGAYTTLSPVVLSRACIHAAGPYRCDHVRVHGRVVGTHHVPYGAFRGFGAPQVCFAVERHMDRIASELGLHPAHLRRLNLLRVGDSTATGQVLAESVGSEKVLERALERSGFEERRWGAPRTGRKRRGVGLALFFHGAGFTGSGEELLKARAAVELLPDGRARVLSSSTDFGQGTEVLWQAIASEALGAGVEDVAVAAPDTAAVPDSGPTVASRTCMVVGGVLAKACRELRRRLEAFDPSPAPFRERARRFLEEGGEGRAEGVYASPPGLEWDEERYRGDAYPAYGWGADVAEVEVDLDTFEVEVTRFLSVVDVGKAILPDLVEGQIRGGSLQSIGFAHLEVVQTREGRFLQDRMSTCIIPGTLDAPPIEVELVEEPFRHGPFGAKGVGELPMDGGAPAVVSAIEDAVGVRATHLPATPERLLEAWLEQHPEEVP